MIVQLTLYRPQLLMLILERRQVRFRRQVFVPRRSLLYHRHRQEVCLAQGSRNRTGYQGIGLEVKINVSNNSKVRRKIVNQVYRK